MSYQAKIHEIRYIFNAVFMLINEASLFDNQTSLAPIDGILGLMKRDRESNWEIVTRENIKEAESAYLSAFYNDHGNLISTANLF